jgi:hypothetical protein
MVESWPEDLARLRTRFQSNEPRRSDTDNSGSRKSGGTHGEKERRKISSDGAIFRMHYQFTSTLLLASSMFLASNLGLGSPISCLGETLGLDAKDLQTFCMNFGTKLLLPALKEVLQDESQYRLWFKWTPLILLFQSVLFYIPHWIWKHCENGWIDAMVKDMRRSDLADNQLVNERKKLTAECFRKGRNTNTVYGATLILCDLLNWMNVTVQLLLLNVMFSYYFIKNPFYTVLVAGENSFSRIDPLELAFPKTITCNIKSFGPSGDVTVKSLLCDVALNHFNEMCVILMWYWFVFLFACTTLSCLANTTLVLTPYFIQSALKVSNKGVAPQVWSKLFHRFGAFDLLVLKTMLDEMYPKMAEDFVTELATQINLYTIQLPEENYI